MEEMGKQKRFFYLNVPISGCLLELGAEEEAQTMRVTAQVSSPTAGDGCRKALQTSLSVSPEMH